MKMVNYGVFVMKHVGIVLFFIGLSFMGLSYYINDRVKQETTAAYQATNTLSDNPLVGLAGPVAEEVSKEASASANQEIEKKAMPYEKLAGHAHSLGLIFVVLGAVIALFYIVRRRT